MDLVIQFEGTIYEQGYGLIAQKVMRDKDLHPVSKSIYAYLCSFAGVGKDGERSAFPGVSLMMHELGIKTDDTFYKYRKQLVQKGYIKVEKRRQTGAKFDSNIYKIVAVPKEIPEEIPKEIPSPKISGTVEPYPKLSSTVEPSTVKSGTIINSSIINSSIINKKEEEEDTTASLILFFEENITKSNGTIKRALKEWVTLLPLEVIMNEISFAAEHNAKSFSYLKKLLNEDLVLKIDSIEKLDHKRNEHTKKKSPVKNKKTTRKEAIPEWFIKQQEERKEKTANPSNIDIEKEREELQRELGAI